MNPTLALLQREWMQHRFAWSMLLLVPLALAVFVIGFSDIQIDAGDELPPPLALAAAMFAACLAVLVTLAFVSGLVTAIGLARRDHADRSVEFWLSLPISHSRSLLVPMLVHLVLVPLLAVAAALVAGFLISLLAVGRVQGLAAWWALPWADLGSGALVALVRLVAGWPLFVLWLAPLILLAMLAYAWLRRWGLVVLGLLLAVGLSPLGNLLGYHMVPDALAAIGNGAAQALISGKDMAEMRGDSGAVVLYSIQQAPSWVLQDIAGSLQNLASPAFVAGLLVAGLCFFGLVQWRKRGASTAV